MPLMIIFKHFNTVRFEIMLYFMDENDKDGELVLLSFWLEVPHWNVFIQIVSQQYEWL